MHGFGRVLRVHDLRRTAATYWLEQGIDLGPHNSGLGTRALGQPLTFIATGLGSTADTVALARITIAFSHGYPRGARVLS